MNKILYLIDVIHAIDGLCFFFLLLSILFILFLCLMMFTEYESGDEDKAFERLFKLLLKKWWILGLVITLTIFIPSQKTMYLMLGSSYLQDSNIPAKVIQVLNKKLDGYLTDKS